MVHQILPPDRARGECVAVHAGAVAWPRAVGAWVAGSGLERLAFSGGSYPFGGPEYDQPLQWRIPRPSQSTWADVVSSDCLVQKATNVSKASFAADLRAFWDAAYAG